MEKASEKRPFSEDIKVILAGSASMAQSCSGSALVSHLLRKSLMNDVQAVMKLKNKIVVWKCNHGYTAE